MDKLNMSQFEETLYILSSSAGKIRKFRHTSVLTSVLFCALFVAMLFSTPVNGYVLLVLGAYALFKLLGVLRFVKVIKTYRSLACRIFARLAERTGDKTFTEKASALSTKAPMERFLRTNMILLTLFYIALLAAAPVVLRSDRSILYAVSFSSVAFVLLTLRLELSAANAVEEFKVIVFENGAKLKELTYGKR